MSVSVAVAGAEGDTVSQRETSSWTSSVRVCAGERGAVLSFGPHCPGAGH